MNAAYLFNNPSLIRKVQYYNNNIVAAIQGAAEKCIPKTRNNNL